ncbi:unnamed protein product [Merluccius merluccius]
MQTEHIFRFPFHGRLREGEVSKISLTDFLLRNTFASNPDLDLALTDVEKKLCKYFERVEIKDLRQKVTSEDLMPSVLLHVNAK